MAKKKPDKKKDSTKPQQPESEPDEDLTASEQPAEDLAEGELDTVEESLKEHERKKDL